MSGNKLSSLASRRLQPERGPRIGLYAAAATDDVEPSSCCSEQAEFIWLAFGGQLALYDASNQDANLGRPLAAKRLLACQLRAA